MDMENLEKDQKEYLSHAKPTIKKLLQSILKARPNNLAEFMEQWAKSFSNQTVVSEEKEENKEKYLPESDDEEHPDDAIEIKKTAKKVNRAGVSAEVYGKFNEKKAYVPKVIPKTEEQKERIKKRLGQAFMFASLDDKEKDIVINAMEEKKFNQGENVISQGDDGDVLYVVDEGELDCFKKFTKESDPKYLKTYKPGESFGELALLYNVPRAATITAKVNATLFSLDRDCFNSIVKDSAIKRREKYEEFLKKVEILESMDYYERSQLCDAIKNMNLKLENILLSKMNLVIHFIL